MEIKDRVAIVTGASSGIGVAVAEALAKQGATVVVAARRLAELEVTAEKCRQYSPESFAVVTDLAIPADCERLVATTQERLGRVDIVVNNAGMSMHRHAKDVTPADIERVMQVNFHSAVRVTMAALPGMLDRKRGSIVNVTSVAGGIPNPKESAYGASKAALNLWTHGLAVDLANTNVHVGVVCPGPIDTEIWDQDETPSSYDGKKYPPEVVARSVVRLIDKEAVHATSPRQYGAMAPMYTMPILGRMVRRGLIQFERAGERKRRLEATGQS